MDTQEKIPFWQGLKALPWGAHLLMFVFFVVLFRDEIPQDMFQPWRGVSIMICSLGLTLITAWSLGGWWLRRRKQLFEFVDARLNLLQENLHSQLHEASGLQSLEVASDELSSELLEKLIALPLRVKEALDDIRQSVADNLKQTTVTPVSSQPDPQLLQKLLDLLVPLQWLIRERMAAPEFLTKKKAWEEVKEEVQRKLAIMADLYRSINEKYLRRKDEESRLQSSRAKGMLGLDEQCLTALTATVQAANQRRAISEYQGQLQKFFQKLEEEGPLAFNPDAESIPEAGGSARELYEAYLQQELPQRDEAPQPTEIPVAQPGE